MSQFDAGKCHDWPVVPGDLALTSQLTKDLLQVSGTGVIGNRDHSIPRHNGPANEFRRKQDSVREETVRVKVRDHDRASDAPGW